MLDRDQRADIYAEIGYIRNRQTNEIILERARRTETNVAMMEKQEKEGAT